MKKKFDECVEKILFSLPQEAALLKADVKQHLREAIKSNLLKLDLVTREEFDAQMKVLARAKEKLAELQKRLDELGK